MTEPEDWFVFETLGADGTLAIGVARGVPDVSAVMVVRDGLTRRDASDVARRLAVERRESGRLPDSIDTRGMPVNLGDE
jgi:hypothetical protein